MNTKIISISAMALLSFNTSAATDETPACCAHHPADENAIIDIALSATSLFHTESQWENRHHGVAPLSQLKGKPQIVAMMYTTCKYACPRIIADLKRIESELSEEERVQVGICLITIDPDRDTVDRFNAYAAERGLDHERWNFLRGSKSDILELANLLGVKYKQLPDGEFSHSNIITLLNSQGEISHQLSGLGSDPTSLVEQTKSLLN